MTTREQTADQEFLARLDAAIGCQQCGGPLTESVSDYFCSERCSMIYSESRASGLVYEYWDEDEHGWTAEALADLEPVSWIAPPVWRLPRSTGDLEADREACDRASETATTASQRAACILRNEDIHRRQRVIWARDWRLPRATGDFWKDNRDCNDASCTATTPAQIAACELRRIEIQTYKPRFGAGLTPGRTTQWGIDDFVFRGPVDLDPTSLTYVYGPYGHGPRAFNVQHSTDEGGSWTDLDLAASPIVHSRISWNPTRAAVEIGVVGSPAPAIQTGDTVTITHDGETLRYEVTGIDGARMTCRRHPEDDQPPVQGATS